MQAAHIKTAARWRAQRAHEAAAAAAASRRHSASTLLKSGALALALVLALATSGEAIVKQQRSDDSLATQQAPHHAQSAHNNHKSPGSQSAASNANQAPSANAAPQAAGQSAASSAQPQVPNSLSGAQSAPSYSSSVSVSSVSSAGNQQQPQAGSNGRADQLSSYQSQSAAGQQYAQMQPKSAYGLDAMSASASSPEQSYQAAAQSVNMALANSGIFGPNSQSGAGYQQPQQAQSGPSNSGASNLNSLNPLHYFYYPAKDASSGSASNKDLLASAASNGYQSMASASYPTYADQLSSALSSLGSAGPEPAASSQDPSYLPQPSGMDGAGQMYNSNANQQPQQQQQQQQPQQANQNQNSPNGQYLSDLGAYPSNLMASQNQPAAGQSQSNGGVSFPASSGPQSNLQSPSQDYMNPGQQSHHQQPQQQQQAVNNAGYHNNLYNQMGDLSTSNFGNNAGGLSSVASYMSPNQPDLHASMAGLASGPGNVQHDFSSLLQGQQFNSAASQLAPAAVSPPSQMSGAAGQSSLFNSASSLFGQQQQAASNQQQQQQQQQQQANNLFANAHYLSSFLSPQQYQQLTGNQALAEQLQAQASNAAGQQALGSASNAVGASASSGKRFGISSFIMPMLALAGLSLLIPTVSSISGAVGRKKRSLDEASSRQQQVYEPVNGASQLAKEMSIGEYMDKIERYYAIYKDAVESDDCLNRLICEFGQSVKDVTGKSAVVTVIEKLVPTWMTGKMHLFKEAAMDNKEGKEKCKKYICRSTKRLH